MTFFIYFVFAVIACTALYVATGMMYQWAHSVAVAYMKYRGKRVIICPETRRPAGVEVDAEHAAVTTAMGPVELQLKSCTRWPEKKDCGQECLAQVEWNAEGCLVMNILSDWYEGKSCVYCNEPFGKIHLLDHKPALLNPEGKTVEWSEIPVEKIPAALDTHMPLCWNCHIAQSFRLEHPELVVDRPWRSSFQAHSDA